MAQGKTIVEQAVEIINQLADDPSNELVSREDEGTVTWNENDQQVRLLGLADMGVNYLQIITSDDELAHTRAYLFNGEGIIQ